ncbi:MAG: flagellar hook-associated protein FlgL [Oscillospiraceae bacterium]|nr:flagellar hook-associated protein FlgL [Oscillospiraceae bacterium]
MRVTDRYSNRLYLGNNNRSLENMLESENRVLTQKAFLRASEDSVNANKAMKIRKGLENLDMYDKNLENAKDTFTAAETNLYHIADNVYLNVNQKLISVQDTYNDDDLDAIALELEEMAEEMVKTMNNDFGGRQLFAGTSNNKEPFTVKYFETDSEGNDIMEPVVDEDGNPVYETNEDGTQVLDEDGNPVQKQQPKEISFEERVHGRSRAEVYFNDRPINEFTDSSKFNGAGGIYIDVGLGVRYNDDGSIVPSTALDISLNGAKLTGCGTDDDNDSLNIIQLTFDAAKAVYNNDRSSANRYIDKLQKAQSTVLSGIAELGIKQNNIEFYTDKNEEYRINLSEQQKNTEGCDLTEEITNWTNREAAYNAALQMGARSVPKSIFEFL